MSESAATKSSADRRKPERDDDAHGDPSALDKRWHQRFKRFLKTRQANIFAAGKTFLKRFGSRSGVAKEPEDTRHVEPSATAQATTDAPAVPRRRLRRFLILLGLVLLAGGLGMGIAYSLLSKVVKDQGTKLESQRQEIITFQLQEQAQAVKLADLLKKFESEQKKCLEAEKQLSEIAQKGPDAEATNSAAQPAKAQQNREKSSGTRSLMPSSSSTFSPPKLVDCNVAASDPGALKRCLDSLNRK